MTRTKVVMYLNQKLRGPLQFVRIDAEMMSLHINKRTGKSIPWEDILAAARNSPSSMIIKYMDGFLNALVMDWKIEVETPQGVVVIAGTNQEHIVNYK